MKFKIITLGLICSVNSIAQTELLIPPLLEGGTYNLTMANDSVSFLPGAYTQTIGYNGAYLGPTLLLEKGETVDITVNNETDDTTTAHWHGLHVAAFNDGGPHSLILSGDSWNPIFEVMDHAATYWYHPHLHTKTGEQAMKGAAGLIIVKDDTEAALELPRNYGVDDFPLVIQTQEFNAENQINPDGMRDSIMLVNGIIDPFVEMPAQVVRMRILNADQERNYNFGFTDDKTFHIIGSDGGLLNATVSATRVRLAPGERVEVLLDLSDMVGETLHLMSYASEIPMGTQGGPSMLMPDTDMPMPMMDSPINGTDFDILEINVIVPTIDPVTTVPTDLVTNVILDIEEVNATRVITFTPKDDPTPMEAMDGPFFFNDSSFNMNRIDQIVPLGNIEIWELRNQTMVAHPFHIHDVQFYILDIDGELPSIDKQGRKDVVSVPPMDTVRFITIFEDFAGETPYMYHCHNLMHEDGGMMRQFVVTDFSGIDEVVNNLLNVSVYPNPAQSTIMVTATEMEQLTVSIQNMSGEIVSRENMNTNVHSLNISDLANGVYLLVISDGTKNMTKKLIIQH
ncbi:MAG: blue copper oxidase [Crocinitomix sp.]|jgi:blue copper oxidase